MKRRKREGDRRGWRLCATEEGDRRGRRLCAPVAHRPTVNPATEFFTRRGKHKWHETEERVGQPSELSEKRGRVAAGLPALSSFLDFSFLDLVALFPLCRDNHTSTYLSLFITLERLKIPPKRQQSDFESN